MQQVDFVNSDGVVEMRINLNADSDYLTLDHTMLGEYTIEVSGSCRVLHEREFEVVLENSVTDVELMAGKLIMVADPQADVPDWDAASREFRTKE